jgi:hypothetical protein
MTDFSRNSRRTRTLISRSGKQNFSPWQGQAGDSRGARPGSLEFMVSITTSNELPGDVWGRTKKTKMQRAAALYQIEHLDRFLILGKQTEAFFKYIDGLILGFHVLG